MKSQLVTDRKAGAGSSVPVDSDDVVAVGLRLLWELDAFLAEIGASRLDDMPSADRIRLHAAFIAASETLAAVHPRRRQQRARRHDQK